ncbi:MAG: hypothetical protein JST92_13415 [Deltaproteobacteria bacterium]|nr:hypothetical protein [Deltaproteobacteria bacterium]
MVTGVFNAIGSLLGGGGAASAQEGSKPIGNAAAGTDDYVGGSFGKAIPPTPAEAQARQAQAEQKMALSRSAVL